jgi:F-type H+-transporting ATPase subunit epsilon
MPQAPIACTVVSPERPLFEGRCERLVVPASDGELGILPRHAPLIAKLGAGVLRLHLPQDDGGNVERFAVRGGFLQVRADRVTLIVDAAVIPGDVDRDALEAELAAVLADLQHPASDEAFRELLHRRAWIEARLSLVV